mmetsp:Transcript_14416/g.57425  ORF Transcript_14416/g.57425 Transcript_14416/m.57425 type:complete len:441 (+) Transcript_14416:235-1557(+)
MTSAGSTHVLGGTLMCMCALERLFFKWGIDAAAKAFRHEVLLVTPFIAMQGTCITICELVKRRSVRATRQTSLSSRSTEPFEKAIAHDLPRFELAALACVDIIHVSLTFGTAAYASLPCTVLLTPLAMSAHEVLAPHSCRFNGSDASASSKTRTGGVRSSTSRTMPHSGLDDYEPVFVCTICTLPLMHSESAPLPGASLSVAKSGYPGSRNRHQGTPMRLQHVIRLSVCLVLLIALICLAIRPCWSVVSVDCRTMLAHNLCFEHCMPLSGYMLGTLMGLASHHWKHMILRRHTVPSPRCINGSLVMWHIVFAVLSMPVAYAASVSLQVNASSHGATMDTEVLASFASDADFIDVTPAHKSALCFVAHLICTCSAHFTTGALLQNESDLTVFFAISLSVPLAITLSVFLQYDIGPLDVVSTLLVSSVILIRCELTRPRSGC